MSNPLVIYHGDADGFCAAWVCQKQWVGEVGFLEAHYGYHRPSGTKLRGKHVFIVDFSYPREELLEIARLAKRVTILDHHKTAQKDLEGIEKEAPNIVCVYDMNMSGARLAYEFFGRSPEDCRWVVDYVEDRDLWRWELTDSREINATIQSCAFDFDVWDALALRGKESAVAEGTAILRYQEQEIQEHVKHAMEVEIAGYKVLGVNTTAKTLTSEILHRLAEISPFAVGWYDDQTCRRYSLRSKKGGIDVSEIAKQFGGGGHVNAAGFEVAVSSEGLTLDIRRVGDAGSGSV